MADAKKQREDDLKKYLGEELKVINPKTGEPKYSNPDEAMAAATARYDAFQRGLKGEKPPAAPETPLDPEAARLIATGAKSWASGGDIPPGRMRYVFANEADKAKATAGGYLPGQATPQAAPAANQGIPTITNPADAAKLPSGTIFFDSNGNRRRVP
jgi:hypothetical protein